MNEAQEAQALRQITTSELACNRRCQREHHLAYALGYRLVRIDDARSLGTLVHFGLDAWWRAKQDGVSAAERLDRALAALKANNTGDEFQLARAEVMLLGYEVRWGADDRYEVIGVEVAYSGIPVVNPETGAKSRTFEHAGKIDVLVRERATGLVWIVEHKTTSEDMTPGSTYQKRLMLDAQVSIYYAAAKALGHNVAGCLYDVLGKPQLRPGNVALIDERGYKTVLDAKGQRVFTKTGKPRETADAAQGFVLQTRPETVKEYRERMTVHVAENPGRYYNRGPVVRLADEETEAAFDVWQQTRSMREAELAGRAPRNPDACVRWNRECDFFGVCTGTASLDDQALYRKAAARHEELV